MQARAVELGIGWYRSLQPRCSGALVWQLQDSWPAVSWSVVDYFGRRKLAWYGSRRAMADHAAALLAADDDPTRLAFTPASRPPGGAGRSPCGCGPSTPGARSWRPRR